MATIQSFNSKIDYFWPEVSRQFPAFGKPQLVPGASLREMAPTVYMKNLIDQDPGAIYVFIEGDPLKGACDRETAKAFYDFLFTDKLQMPSSFEVNDGMSHEEAIDMEVLPREGTREYNGFQSYYDEQMRKAEAARRQADHDRRAEKLGFDPDDPDIIDVDVDGNVAGSSNTTAVGQAQSTAVGMPKKIFYAVVAHPGTSDNMLGYDRGSNRLSGREDYRRLREDEKKNDPIAEIKKIMKDLDKSSGLWIELDKVCDKFGTNVDEEVNKILECDTNEDEEDQVKAAKQEETPVEKPEETSTPDEPAEQTDECDKCGDDDCKAGEKCGLKEADTKVVPDDDYDVEAEYNSSLPPEKRKIIVRQSEAGSPDDDDPLNESFDIGQVQIWRELITERS